MILWSKVSSFFPLEKKGKGNGGELDGVQGGRSRRRSRQRSRRRSRQRRRRSNKQRRVSRRKKENRRLEGSKIKSGSEQFYNHTDMSYRKRRTGTMRGEAGSWAAGKKKLD